VGEDFQETAGDQDEQIIVAARQVACHACGRGIGISGKQPFALFPCPHCQARLTVPGKIGEFLLLKELGRGSLGATYRAFDRHLSRQAAVKVVRRTVAAHPQQVSAFLQEAKAQASLDHHNIVQIYSLHREQERPYIVMEYLGDGSLSDRVQSGPLDEPAALQIGLALAEALGAAASAGLLHGDIRPGNVLFEQDTPKLVDFGLARFLTPSPQLAASLPYMAPERLAGQPADVRGDIYSLGATLFHVLSGSPPFAPDVAADVQARQQHPAPSILKVRPVHPATAVLVDAMLAGDPQRRPQDYDALLALMRQTLQRLAGQFVPTPATAAPAVRVAKPRPVVRKKKADLRLLLLFLILLLLGVALVIGILFFAWSMNRTPPTTWEP